MKRKVFITGGSGYIGSHLLLNLIENGFEVTAIIRNTTKIEKLPPVSSSFRIYSHNGETKSLVQWITQEKPDAIFHLAALSKDNHKTEDIDLFFESNLLLGTQILEGLREAGHGHFINTGTFWQHYQGTVEYDPTCLYAATKQAFEDILLYYSLAAKVPSVTLKLFDVYGPRDPRKRLFSLLQEAQSSGSPLLLSPGDQQLDLIYIDDVVRAYQRADQLLQKDLKLSGKTFALSSQKRMSLREVVKLFEEITDKPVPVKWGGKPYREREVMIPFQGEILPDWSPKINLKEGIAFLTEEKINQSKQSIE